MISIMTLTNFNNITPINRKPRRLIDSIDTSCHTFCVIYLIIVFMVYLIVFLLSLNIFNKNK